MVAAGGSPRVVRRRAALRRGAARSRASALAAAAGVRIVPLWMPDDAGADIAVERVDDG